MKFAMRKKTAYATTAVFLLLATRSSLSLTPRIILDEPLLSETVFKSTPFYTSHHGTLLGEPHRVDVSCSVVTASYGDKVFLGGNADTRPCDYAGTAPYLFFFPHRTEDDASESGYGFVVFGWEWEQNAENHKTYVSGMNEKGLAFGVSGLPPVPLNPHPERPYSASSETFEIRAMRECSDVACVIELAQNFDWGDSSALLNQYHFADSGGDAVIISAGKEGELAFTKKEKGDGYLISTNFNRANPDNGTYPCWRYDTAVSMLQKSEQGDSLALDRVASVLDAIHVEGALLNTTVTYIFDMCTDDIYAYHFHQFDEVVRINLAEALADERFSGYNHMICHATYLPRLFSQKTKEMAVSDFQRCQDRFFALILIFFSALGLSVFLLYKKDHKKSTQNP